MCVYVCIEILLTMVKRWTNGTRTYKKKSKNGTILSLSLLSPSLNDRTTITLKRTIERERKRLQIIASFF